MTIVDQKHRNRPCRLR